MLHAGQYDLTGRNLPKIRQPREPEPSTINEKTIADFTRVVEQTGILERAPFRAPMGCSAKQLMNLHVNLCLYFRNLRRNISNPSAVRLTCSAIERIVGCYIAQPADVVDHVDGH